MLPISIENMDRNKEFGKNIEDIKSIIERYNFNLTVDLQHFFTNDPSMESAINFQKIYKKNIVVYHLSGYDKKFLHYPLFKTGQNEIIKSVMHKEIPIIIESTFDKLGEETKELNHIMGLI